MVGSLRVRWWNKLNMERAPQFIREFSKKESPEERQQAAQAIKAKRAEHFTEKRVLTERQSELQRTTSERERVLAERLESIRKLENEIAELSALRAGEILNYLQLRKIRADVALGQRTYDELKQLQDREVAEQQVISEKLGIEETPLALRKAKWMLDNFYQGQKEKWAGSEYTKEDITEHFSEEHLASLSLEDYALLLKRFPSEMVAHVTRQGVRDHTGHIFHTAGVGVYSDGFMKMVKDGRLRSPLGVCLIEDEKEQAIARFLHLDNFENRKEVLDHLAIVSGSQGKAGTYADRMAVHFATEEVADCYYGSEKGNEIFVVYPSAFIASQYYFKGQLNEAGGGYWNDQWVWANEERGMDLDAGIVFIPEEAKVDRKTGSRYQLDEGGNPVENSEFRAAFKRVADSADFYNFASQVMEIAGLEGISTDELNLSPENQKLFEKLEPFRQRLGQEFGIIDRRLQSAILNYANLDKFKFHKEASSEEGRGSHERSVDSIIDEALKDEGIFYAEAKDTIISKDFWEARFAENPEKRPSKVVYYKGADPTWAFLEWRKKCGIRKRAADKSIGFSERNIQPSEPHATIGVDRFISLSEKVIENYFASKEKERERVINESLDALPTAVIMRLAENMDPVQMRWAEQQSSSDSDYESGGVNFARLAILTAVRGLPEPGKFVETLTQLAAIARRSAEKPASMAATEELSQDEAAFWVVWGDAQWGNLFQKITGQPGFEKSKMRFPKYFEVFVKQNCPGLTDGEKELAIKLHSLSKKMESGRTRLNLNIPSSHYERLSL